MSKFERVEICRRYADHRGALLTIADLMSLLALTQLELGQRLRQPEIARKAGRSLIQAYDHYKRAGLGRKAVAVARLLERCRRAWNRHEELEGFR